MKAKITNQSEYESARKELYRLYSLPLRPIEVGRVNHQKAASLRKQIVAYEKKNLLIKKSYKNYDELPIIVQDELFKAHVHVGRSESIHYPETAVVKVINTILKYIKTQNPDFKK